jgi:hypothetical protein
MARRKSIEGKIKKGMARRNRKPKVKRKSIVGRNKKSKVRRKRKIRSKNITNIESIGLSKVIITNRITNV